MALLLGYDVGSSSIKATLMEAETGKVLASATSPEKELEIIAKKIGWAEQHPETWWEHVKKATQKIAGKLKVKIRNSERAAQSAFRTRCTAWWWWIRTRRCCGLR